MADEVPTVTVRRVYETRCKCGWSRLWDTPESATRAAAQHYRWHEERA